MEAMKDMAAAMKSLGEMTRGKVAFDATEAAAGRIAAHAGEAPTLFPDGSFRMPSEARARIAEERDRFAGLAGDLRRAAGAMQTAARANDVKALAAARRGAGQVCSGCHKLYREHKHHH
jgi:cytochrome c556